MARPICHGEQMGNGSFNFRPQSDHRTLIRQIFPAISSTVMLVVTQAVDPLEWASIARLYSLIAYESIGEDRPLSRLRFFLTSSPSIWHSTSRSVWTSLAERGPRIVRKVIFFFSLSSQFPVIGEATAHGFQ